MSRKKILHSLGLPHNKQLSPKEVTQAAHRRVLLIDKEFRDTFKLISTYSKSVTFFGSARSNENNIHYVKAELLAKRLSKLGFTIVTGGGPGIMEAANRGAYDASGKSVGFNIDLPREQHINKYATVHHDYYYFFARKVALSFAAEAFLFFPGGFGTLNELFEILTLVQTRRVPPMPIILVGAEFWQPLDEFIRKHLLENHAMISKNDVNLYTICDDDEKIVEIVQKAPLVSNIDFPETR